MEWMTPGTRNPFEMEMCYCDEEIGRVMRNKTKVIEKKYIIENRII